MGAPVAAADAGPTTAQSTIAATPLPTPTLLRATLAWNGNDVGVVGSVNLTFDAPLPEGSLLAPPDYVVWADGKFVAMTSFPHDVHGAMSVLICRDTPDGATFSCGFWLGDQHIFMTGRETYTITQQAGATPTDYGPSAPSNGLVPTVA